MNEEFEHHEVWQHIPWYVNDRMDASMRQRVDAHLRNCHRCREELVQQRRVHAVLSADAGMQVLPGASLNRLRQRLDAAPAPTRPVPQSRRPLLMAAAVAAMVVTLGVVMVTQRPQLTGAQFHTVTQGAVRPPEEAIRAVFKPQTTVAQLQALLDRAQVRIVAGPTEAGVYSLALTAGQPVSEALARLRRQPEVRFAEATVPLESAPSASSNR